MKRFTWKATLVLALSVLLLALLTACEIESIVIPVETEETEEAFYEVVFDANGGTEIPPQQVAANSIIQPPTTTRTGYTFAGWSYDFSDPIQENICAVASWTPNTYKITYLPNGGTVNRTSQTVTFGRWFSFPTPTREMYNFVGWYADDVLVTDQSVWSRTEDLTLQAKWEEIPCFIVQNGTIVKIEEFARDRQAFTIPEAINGERITAIGERVFQDCKNLTSITIPNSVTSIGDSAFSGCTALTNITIPDSVTNIGDSAFSACTSLTGITIPNSVTSIGESAFRGCSSLTSITIPDSVTSIGTAAFADCISLTDIIIPNSVTSISTAAFNNCTGLISITIPFVEAFDRVVFGRVTSLKTIVITGGISIGNSAFSGYSNLTSITIPDSVTSIGDRAFSGCGSLTNITIPDGITRIGEYTFSKCSSLTDITIPNSVTSIGKYAFSECSNLTNITIPDGVTSIGEYTFSECGSLTSVTIPNSVTSIGSFAFEGCTSLTSITVAPDNPVYHTSGNCLIQTKEKILILGCKNSVIPLDGSVTSLSSYAFAGCNGLTSITIPNSVTSIGYHAFSGCTGLTSIHFNGTKVQWQTIEKYLDLDVNTGAYTVHCTDGDIPKESD